MVGANTTRQKVKARKAFNREMGKAAWVKSGYVCA